MRTLTRLALTILILLSAYSVLAIYLNAPFNPILTPLTTLVGSAFALLHGSQRIGWGRTLLLLGLTFGVSLLFESVGVATGLVYGQYHYTDDLGYRFLGLVPLVIPIAWFMMMYPSYLIADRIIPPGWKPWARGLALAAVGGVVMTAWDLAMDPMMVAGQHWVWEVEGAYFGIPLQNFWGWWLTTFVTLILFLIIGGTGSGHQDTQSERLAIISYAVTGLSSIMIDLRVGLEGAGLAGIFAMLPWVVAGWMRRADSLLGQT